MTAATQNDRLRMLAAMGIDVWVRRGSHPPRAELVTPAPRPTPRDEPERRRVSEPVEEHRASRNDGPEAHDAPAARRNAEGEEAQNVAPVVWTAVGVGRVVLLARLGTPSERRVAQDIALAAAGYPSEVPTLVTFTRTRASGSAVAPEMVAFVRGQLDRRGGSEPTTLILTEGAAQELWLDPSEGAASPFPGARLIVVPEMEALRTSPERKQSVWRALIRHR